MPIHEYEMPNGGIIEIVESSQTVIPKSWKRLMSIGSFSTGSVKEQGMSEKVKEGYYKRECESGSRFSSKYSKKQIKTAWGW